MAKQRSRHQFTVVIDGLDLDKEVLGRVNTAIQKAAVAALADLDLQGDFRFHFPRYPRPEWWGLWLDRILPAQLEQGGFVTPEEFGTFER